MIGLSVLGALGLWLIVSIVLSKKIPQWFGIIKYKTAIGVLLFPLIVVMPIADDLIGMWQFRQLCEKEAVVVLSPNWRKVKRAKWVDLSTEYYNQYIIPITSNGGEYIDIDRNKVFMSIKFYYTKGGFLRRHSGLSASTSCKPKNYAFIRKKINLDKLMTNGELK